MIFQEIIYICFSYKNSLFFGCSSCLSCFINIYFKGRLQHRSAVRLPFWLILSLSANPPAHMSGIIIRFYRCLPIIRSIYSNSISDLRCQPHQQDVACSPINRILNKQTFSNYFLFLSSIIVLKWMYWNLSNDISCWTLYIMIWYKCAFKSFAFFMKMVGSTEGTYWLPFLNNLLSYFSLNTFLIRFKIGSTWPAANLLLKEPFEKWSSLNTIVNNAAHKS